MSSALGELYEHYTQLKEEFKTVHKQLDSLVRGLGQEDSFHQYFFYHAESLWIAAPGIEITSYATRGGKKTTDRIDGLGDHSRDQAVRRYSPAHVVRVGLEHEPRGYEKARHRKCREDALEH